MNLFLVLAILLLILGIIGSFTPTVPGVLVSAAGILVYWWSTGYTEPGAIFLALTVILTALGLLFDWFSGAITAKIGGASNKTSYMAGAAGVIGFIFLGGPVGMLLAVAGSVFVREYLRTGDARDARKAGVYTALGILASAFTQVMITSFLLAGFLLTLVF
jgi:uncharacterized protein YqgC (DUF456 family)